MLATESHCSQAQPEPSLSMSDSKSGIYWKGRKETK